MAVMRIRRITAEERAALSLPVQTYAFGPSPIAELGPATQAATHQYAEGHVLLVAEQDGAAQACVAGVLMRQNLRGGTYPMAGVADLATAPLARRRGFGRALLDELLGQLRDGGQVVSTVYPFRPSYYERFGFVGLPRTRSVSFAPGAFVGLLHADLGGEVDCVRIGSGYDAYRRLTLRMLEARHGFSVLPAARARRIRDLDEHWLVSVRVDGRIAGALTYRITGHGGELAGDDLLATGPLARALLLQFVARHVDQVATVTLTVAPDEYPELWATDLEAVTTARLSFPASPAPMARVLSLAGLDGLACGPGLASVEIVGDRFLAGTYMLDGRPGALVVQRDPGVEPAATLTVAGLSALVYGVLGPAEIAVRGYGSISAEGARQLATLFPPSVPYLFASF
jgi:predicted N-acetyltransferase YhbS